MFSLCVVGESTTPGEEELVNVTDKQGVVVGQEKRRRRRRSTLGPLGKSQ